MSDWQSTETIETACAWLAGRQRIALVTHQKPDGDAAGATLALGRTVRRLGRQAAVIYAGPEPHWLGEFGAGGEWALVERDGLPQDDFDAVVICDTGSRDQLGPLLPLVSRSSGRCLIIDHHLSGEGDLADRLLIDTRAAAVCEPIGRLCARMLDCPVAGLPREIAEALYLGVGTDTGWLRYSNVTPRTLRLAAELIEAGADPAGVYERVEQRERAARIRLLARALGSLRLLVDETLAVLRITREDIRLAGAAPSDTGGFTDLPMSIRSVRVVAVLTEVEAEGGAPLTKISLRSKPGPGAVDVNQIAAALGGGGHARAAGARIGVDLDSAEAAIIKALGG
ncbi:MAG: bifunctional oligoribonuclease/PAP phosphatase NrnA [Phycisphaerales bacterium JB039]